MKTKAIRILAFSFNVIILGLLIVSLGNIEYFLESFLSFRFYETNVLLIRFVGLIHVIAFFVFFFNKGQKMDEYTFLERREDILKLEIENESLKKALNEIKNK